MMASRIKKGAGAASIVMALVSAHEGYKLTPYFDPPGILTVCRGHTGPDVKPGVRWTDEQCDEASREDVRDALADVDRCHQGLPEPVRGAFADAVFNLGATIACDKKNSTAARHLYAGDYEAACRQLPRWNKARIAGVPVELPGLTKRRAEEMSICLTYKDVPS